ncbi:hypothetical protein [Aquamicrobium sp.]|uniref:hypothetical protein n=1 Tax=Aquamicrobium sp. TaxID=1872579 RepID=UPI0025850DDE|nr:hypothetical protein [Aquamicrobium sp.]MCK9549473.1 hypothetical protein [Aquamicrobium sp.]
MWKLKIIIKELWKSFLFLPGTFIHELTHLIVALLLGAKIKSFTIIPRVKFIDRNHYTVVYGSVEFSPKISAFNFLIGMAPLLMLIPIYLILEHLHFFQYNGTYWELYFDELLAFSNWFYISILLELLSGCLPSTQDIKMSFEGLFSFSGLVMFVIIGFIVLTMYR